MAYGFQCFNAQGQLIVDITDRLTRIIGEVYTGTSNGSINVPEFSLGGTPWVFIQQDNTNNNQFQGRRQVRASVSGTTLSWTFEGLTKWPANPATIQYGVY
jgi:hypothetical protein